jgi:alpha-1,2-mannosyltransferase
VAVSALVLLGAVAVVALLVATAGWEPPPLQDLRVYRDGAARVLDHLPLYPPGSRYAPDQPLPFTYPPFAALAFVPLALLPVGSAAAGWWLLTLALLTWFVLRSFAPALRGLGLPARGAAVVLLVCATSIGLSPVVSVIGFGQIGMVLAALCLLDLDRAVRRSPWTGLLVGLSAAVKLTPAAFAFTLLVAGRRRAVLVAAATCATAWVVAALILPDDTRDWLGVVRDVDRIGPVAGAVNTSWHGLWLRLLGDSPATTAIWLMAAAATLAVGAVRSGRLLRAGHSLTAATVMGLATVLASPVSWLHHAVWVVPLIGIVLDDARSPRRWAAAVALAAVFSEPMAGWQFLEPGSPELVGVVDWLWVNLGILAMAAAVLLLRPGPGTRPTAPVHPERPAEPDLNASGGTTRSATGSTG